MAKFINLKNDFLQAFHDERYSHTSLASKCFLGSFALDAQGNAVGHGTHLLNHRLREAVWEKIDIKPISRFSSMSG